MFVCGSLMRTLIEQSQKRNDNFARGRPPQRGAGEREQSDTVDAMPGCQRNLCFGCKLNSR